MNCRRALSVLRSGSALIAALVTVVLTAGPVLADGEDLLVSTTGADWHTSLTRHLFGDVTYVPGDTHEAELYVQNASDTAAALRVDVVDVSGTSALQRAMRLGAQTETGPVGDGRAVELYGPGHGHATTIFTRKSVPAGAVVPLRLRLRLPATAGNESMRGHLAFSVRVVLGDSSIVVPGIPPRGPTSGHGNAAHHSSAGSHSPDGGLFGDMPRTGAAVQAWLVVAVIVLGIGIAAVVAARHTRKDRT